MPDAVLNVEEAAVLAKATAALQGGDAREAIERLGPLVRNGCRDADALLAYSVACQQAGYLDPAEGAARFALQQSPERADLWAQLGIVLDQSGRPEQAVQMLERSTALEPENSSYWYNLGIAALSAASPARAVKALLRSVDIEPGNIEAWGALGLAQQLSGEVEQSEQSFRKALELGGPQLGIIHNFSVTLRILDRSAEALALMDEALNASSMPPQSQMLRADLLSDVGKYDGAAEAYTAVIRANPGAIDAHETLARLLPQLDRSSEQLSAYEEALRVAPTLELYDSAMRTACELKEVAALQKWSSEAIQRFGQAPNILLMQGLAHGLAAETSKAVELLEQLVASGFAPALVPAAHQRLKLGDVRRAESHAITATRANAADQSAWAHLTIIWRLLEDEREEWLADYHRLVILVDLQPPEGFETIQSFMSKLADDLHPLHATMRHPAEQSLRQGTQTRGHLFEKRDASVRQLATIVEQAIVDAIGQLPGDSAHPFLARNTGRTRFLGSWSVRLAKGGFHLSHMHPLGWLSSALYVALPAETTVRDERGASPGCLTFGVPERELGLDLGPRRIEIPKVGRLILFPSYFWHGTMPFESEDYRLTVAFDAAPEA